MVLYSWIFSVTVANRLTFVKSAKNRPTYSELALAECHVSTKLL